MAKQYVQHISGQGEKWEVLKLTLGGDDGSGWPVRSKENFRSSYTLPKSEYVLCEPPPPVVQWKDVTAECEVNESGWITHHDRLTTQDNGYRRRKVQLEYPLGASFPWAIIIEQKVTA